MSASTEPRYGEVWIYEGTRWMLVTPDALSRPHVNAWLVLYLGGEEGPANAMEYAVGRAKVGRSPLDSMAGLPGPDQYVNDKWKLAEGAPR
jgi:hypothetical protein